MSAKSCVRWFDDIRLTDVPAVGGKTASLGELYSLLGARIPEGFALTAAAYRDALAEAGVWEELRRLLSNFDHHDVTLLAERAAHCDQPPHGLVAEVGTRLHRVEYPVTSPGAAGES